MIVRKKSRRARSTRRGQIMGIFALAAVGVVGIAALGIDVFYLYWNKNRLQSGTDAAALAGATYFNNVSFSGKDPSCTYATDAQNAACTYALSNGVSLSELTGVVANSGNQSMTVSATRTISAGSCGSSTLRVFASTSTRSKRMRLDDADLLKFMQHQHRLNRPVQHLIHRRRIEQPVHQTMMPLHQTHNIRLTPRNEIED